MSGSNGILGSSVIVELRDRVKGCETRIEALDDGYRVILDRLDSHLEDAVRVEVRVEKQLSELRTDIQWIRKALEERRPQSTFFTARGPFGLELSARNVAPWVLFALTAVLALALWLSR